MLLLNFLFSFLLSSPPLPQIDPVVIVKEIRITGNHKTRENIILRELDFVVGDSLNKQNLEKRLELNRRKIMNTNLFISTEVTVVEELNNEIVIEIKLQEQWFILGYPVFQIADRNLNEWWERGHQFGRTIYGVHLIHSNFRGKAERLQLNLETGFTQRVDLIYRMPYIDKAQKTGLGFSISYATNKNVAFSTINDTLAYRRSEDKVLRERFNAAVSLKKRYHFYDNHTLELRYNNNSIDDTIRRLNPNYFGDGRTSQKYFQLSYYFNYDFRDNVTYPLRGKRYELLINQSGLLPVDDIHQFEVTGTYSRFHPISQKWFLGMTLEGKVSFPGNQPFYNTRGLGYGSDLVRGYELFVVDGSSYFYSRNTLRYKLLDRFFKIKFLKVKQINNIPLGIYPNIYADFGYASNQYTERNLSKLANKGLFGGGFGIDIVTYYNVVWRLNYSFNGQGQSGFVFNINREF